MPRADYSPAFLFYPQDFSSDGKVEAMTTEEVGAYVLILCKAWFETPPGSAPNDDIVLARWARLSAEVWNEHRTAVLSPFSLGDDGRWHQKRMVREFKKLQSVKKKRQAAGRAGAKERWQTHSKGIDLPMAKNAIHIPIPIQREREESAHAEPFEPSLTDIERALCEICEIEPGMMGGMMPQDLRALADRLKASGRTGADVRLFGRRWSQMFPTFTAPKLVQVGNDWRRVMGESPGNKAEHREEKTPSQELAELRADPKRMSRSEYERLVAEEQRTGRTDDTGR